jgi:ABC-type branched-subunit amino acid transport system substrate-binding protein
MERAAEKLWEVGSLEQLMRGIRVGSCLSLSGRFERFGKQVALGLEVWAERYGGVELVIEDDRSDIRELERVLPGVLAGCDVALGPYSTGLMRRAGEIAATRGGLLWNHGGAGDDVQAGHQGNLVSVLTPASRYATPFIDYLVSKGLRTLCIEEGKGSFGRQVAEGARSAALERGIEVVRVKEGEWSLFSAGTFEEDVASVGKAKASQNPPKLVCAVGAGVHRFAQEIKNPAGIFGVGQWISGTGRKVELGPEEGAFLRSFKERTGEPPDYPAIQAVAAAVIGVHCVEQAGSTSREAVWGVATALETSTMFGPFRVDPVTGMQRAHQGVLMRWAREGLSAAAN